MRILFPHGGQGFDPYRPMKISNINQIRGCHLVAPGWAMWHPFIHHMTCHVSTMDWFHVTPTSQPCHIMSYHIGHTNRMVNCQVACIDCTINIFLPVLENRQNAISFSYLNEDEIYTMNPFSSIFENFDFLSIFLIL
jgi:hypothetical protein